MVSDVPHTSGELLGWPVDGRLQHPAASKLSRDGTRSQGDLPARICFWRRYSTIGCERSECAGSAVVSDCFSTGGLVELGNPTAPASPASCNDPLANRGSGDLTIERRRCQDQRKSPGCVSRVLLLYSGGWLHTCSNIKLGASQIAVLK